MGGEVEAVQSHHNKKNCFKIVTNSFSQFENPFPKNVHFGEKNNAQVNCIYSIKIEIFVFNYKLNKKKYLCYSKSRKFCTMCCVFRKYEINIFKLQYFSEKYTTQHFLGNVYYIEFYFVFYQVMINTTFTHEYITNIKLIYHYQMPF